MIGLRYIIYKKIKSNIQTSKEQSQCTFENEITYRKFSLREL